MIDPILSLAISVQSNPGVYMLLLGSGVSRAAGIPTGWEVVLDLIRRLAQLKGEESNPDPAEWYRQTFGEEPDYSRLLDEVAKSPAERQQLLRTYFEPTEEEREEGLKLPTAAHRAVASLVAKGYVKVVLTTNFDRLLEKALEAEGVTPMVIDTTDRLSGAMPIVHSMCTVIKVHGDYLDARIRNTPQELESYPVEIDRLLDRVFDEFGLIVCGWSAEWDTALRAGIERCSTRRFSTYWSTFGEPAPAAKSLVAHRRGQILKISGADAFFGELLEKVESLESLRSPHPLSGRVAAATAKRLLAEPRYRIRLHDLFTEETERVVLGMDVSAFPTSDGSDAIFLDQVVRYESLSEPLRAMLSAGCYWGEPSHSRLWGQCVERLARTAGDESGYDRLVQLRRYPALLCMYAGGIAAVAAENYDALKAILVTATFQEHHAERPLVRSLYNLEVMDPDDGLKLAGSKKRHPPLSEHIHAVLRESLRGVIADDIRYTRMFDRYEYLQSMVYADQEPEDEFASAWVPVGSFLWRDRDPRTGLIPRLRTEIESAGAAWLMLSAGFFRGSVDRALSLLETTEQHTKAMRRQYFIH
jgi:hypothetical protein